MHFCFSVSGCLWLRELFAAALFATPAGWEFSQRTLRHHTLYALHAIEISVAASKMSPSQAKLKNEKLTASRPPRNPHHSPLLTASATWMRLPELQVSTSHKVIAITHTFLSTIQHPNLAFSSKVNLIRLRQKGFALQNPTKTVYIILLQKINVKWVLKYKITRCLKTYST